MIPPRIVVRDLTIRAGGAAVVEDVSFDLHGGRALALVGESGSGKTTLLGCLSGRLAATRGSIEVAQRVSTVHQDLRLVKQRTALDNILDGALCRLPAQADWLADQEAVLVAGRLREMEEDSCFSAKRAGWER